MKLLPKVEFGAALPQDLRIMLPELTLSALPRHLWLGIKVMASIAGLYALAAPSPWAGFDRSGMAHLAAKKTIDYDPVVTGSVPKIVPRQVKKAVKV
ncbi:hypothetical protein [Methylobacterium sp. E-045]|uniref:hypothetical protein n=1 Tax=Methylobacterium sp. E-045 TaxID=2836575 RepID=UPI001FBABD5A|nr:hypothetical protein [Methylobacterium sp. E-045]MCJ2132441.1 hypothetical protein [Methylobacterium sp. E-045]